MTHPITLAFLQERLAEIKKLFPVGTILIHSSSTEFEIKSLGRFNIVEPVADLPVGICYGAKYVWYASKGNGWRGEYTATVKQAVATIAPFALREIEWADGKVGQYMLVNNDKGSGRIKITKKQWKSLQFFGFPQDRKVVDVTEAQLNNND